MPDLIETLRTQARTARAACDELVTRARTAGRDLTADELRAFEGHLADANAAADRLADERDREVRELRAAAVRTRRAGVDDGAGELLMRAITEGSGIGAAATPPEYAGAFWDRLAPASVLLQAGPQVVTTSRDSLVIPRVLGDATASFVAEAATIPLSDPTGDTLTATPRKIAALTQTSNEALADGSPSIGDMITRSLVRSVGLGIDLGAFEGSGTAPAMRGLRNVAGVGTASMGANGAALTNLDPIADAIGAIAAANGQASAIFMHPTRWASLCKIKEATGSAVPLMNGAAGNVQNGVQRSILGVPVYLSSQLSTTDTQGSSSAASRIYVADMSQVVVVRREDVAVETDRSALFSSDQTLIRAIARVDVVVPNPSAVFVLTGVL